MMVTCSQLFATFNKQTNKQLSVVSSLSFIHSCCCCCYSLVLLHIFLFYTLKMLFFISPFYTVNIKSTFTIANCALIRREKCKHVQAIVIRLAKWIALRDALRNTVAVVAPIGSNPLSKSRFRANNLVFLGITATVHWGLTKTATLLFLC